MRSRFIVVGMSAFLGLTVLAGCNKTASRTNAQVAAEVQSKIGSDSRVTSNEIGVQAESGVVTLSGNVASDVERTAAAKDAATVDGVKTVINNLAVQQGQNEVAASNPSNQKAGKKPTQIAKSTPTKPDAGL